MVDDLKLRQQTVRDLIAGGWLHSQPWIDAFSTVPRHLFLSRFFTLAADGAHYGAVSSDDPDAFGFIYSNTVLPTQLDGDDRRWQQARLDGPVTGEPTCSSTQPSLMAVMLEALEVRDGDLVLEIGTGTGYNAALLSHRLGSGNVISVDIDAGLVGRARSALHAAGYAPTLAAADGAEGFSQNAPYDKLIATCSVRSIPASWLTLVRPGGTILTSLYRNLVGGSLVRLVVAEDGSASGPLLDDCGAFMPLRAQQRGGASDLIRLASKQSGEVRKNRLPSSLADGGESWTVVADLLMTEVSRVDIQRPDGNVQWLVHPEGSWAYHQIMTSEVEQGGPQRLWDQLEHAYDAWQYHGKPARDRIGATVSPDGDMRIWLQSPENVVNLLE